MHVRAWQRLKTRFETEIEIEIEVRTLSFDCSLFYRDPCNCVLLRGQLECTLLNVYLEFS